MGHSIALVTGATSGLGYASARLLAGKGYCEVIVTGRSQAVIQETAARLAAETKAKIFTPLELDLNAPARVQAGYTFDRIERLEREVGRLQEKLRQSRDPRAVDPRAEIKVTEIFPSRASASVSRRNPPVMWDMASRGWSHISIAEPGRLAFLSGQIAAAPGFKEVPEDIAGQAKLATASLAIALQDLEATSQDIVMLRVYVVNATSEAFGQAMTPLREMLGDAMPSITTIGVQALYTTEIRVEIEMVVRLP